MKEIVCQRAVVAFAERETFRFKYAASCKIRFRGDSGAIVLDETIGGLNFTLHRTFLNKNFQLLLKNHKQLY